MLLEWGITVSLSLFDGFGIIQSVGYANGRDNIKVETEMLPVRISDRLPHQRLVAEVGAKKHWQQNIQCKMIRYTVAS